LNSFGLNRCSSHKPLNPAFESFEQDHLLPLARSYLCSTVLASRHTSPPPLCLPSMKSPKRKRVSDAKGGVLIVDQVKAAVPEGTAVWFDLSKGNGIQGASIFRTDLNDHLVLITSFLDRCNLCSNRAHELDSARCKCATLGGYHIRKEGTANR